MDNELKPCPFCGGEAKIGDASVYCSNCTAIVWAWPYDNIQSAIDTWNSRAEPKNIANEDGEYFMKELTLEQVVYYLNSIATIDLSSNEYAAINRASYIVDALAKNKYAPAIHAHWDSSYLFTFGKYRCTNCSEYSYERKKYCPDCGALMDEQGDCNG